MRLRPMICEICGGAEFVEKNGVLVCIHCDANYPKHIEESEEAKEARILRISRLDDAEKELRMSPPHFDIAEDKFSELIRQYPEWSVGYWGVVRAKYGIKYELDMDGKAIPSCYKSSYEDFRNDTYFKKAIELAENDEIKEKYQSEGDRIARTCKEWRETASQYDYDIFISFKASENGEETRDAREMQNLYTYLTEQGYKVFFSPVSMRSIVGKADWDAYIFNALEKSKVMILYGSNVEYFTTTWIENEWTRYMRMIERGAKNPDSLIVAYENFDANSLPRQLRNLQAVNAADRTFYITLSKRISDIISKITIIPSTPKAKQISIVDGKLLHEKVDFFFNVTIPAAIKQNATIGHTLFVCESPAIRNTFMNMLVSAIDGKWDLFRCDEPTFVRNMRRGDLAARLTNFTEGCVALQFDEFAFSSKECNELMKFALSESYLPVTIGKGPGARFVRIDLPPFTTVAIVSKISSVNKELISCFENVIDLSDISTKDWLPLEISYVASDNGMIVSQSASEEICKKAKWKVERAYQLLKMVNDYQTLYGVQTTLDEQYVQDVLSKIE